MQIRAVADTFVESSRIPLILIKNEEGEMILNDLAKDILQKFHIRGQYKDICASIGRSLNGITIDELVTVVRNSGEPLTEYYAFAPPQSSDILACTGFPVGNGDVPLVCLQLRADSMQGMTPGSDTNHLLMQERAAEYADLNSFLTAILDSSTETFIIAVSQNGTILSFNNGACNMFQYAKREVVGRLHISDLFAPSDRESGVWEEMVADAFAREKSERTTNLLRHDGTIFPALVDLTPLRNSENQTLGTLFLGRDMSETLKTQRALADRKEELEFINLMSLQMSESLKVEEVAAIALKQLHHKFYGMYSALYLLNREEMLYRLTASIPAGLPDEREQLMYPTIDDSLLMENGELLIRGAGKITELGDYTVPKPAVKLMIPLTQKASLIGVAVVITPRLYNRDDELIRFGAALGATIGSTLENSILFNDSITKSQEIKKQNQELDEFAYVVSHDLKEPLAGISFISNLLVDEYYNSFDETGKTYIASLIDFSKRLGALIDALLDLSRIGRITNQLERVDLQEVLFNVKQNLSHRLNRDEVEFLVPRTVPYVYGDKTRIEQVFFNLVGNAIKFNDKPRPRVEIGYAEYSGEQWQFYVRDNGIGIESEYFEKIFKIFERLQPREEYEGNGAGLTIVKKIVEHHGGKVWLESVLDEGTTFYFTLPKFNETS